MVLTEVFRMLLDNGKYLGALEILLEGLKLLTQIIGAKIKPIDIDPVCGVGVKTVK